MSVARQEAEAALQEALQLRKEAEALRPKTTWLAAVVESLLKENHLSERVRNALEAKP